MKLYDKTSIAKLRRRSTVSRLPKPVGLYLLAMLWALVSCQGGRPADSSTAAVAEAVATSPSAKPEIHWFEGAVEEAFAEARAQGKPLFVYWGASWCPPCNQLKANLFPRPDFIEQTRRYVAVHVDGDDPDAQRWAEHFGAMGYPTLIVFDRNGNELDRLSSGMELERYARVLASTATGRSLQELVLQAATDAGQLTVQEWERLAWYPWAVDEDRTMPADERLALFDALREAGAPSGPLQRRVELVWWLEREYQQRLEFLGEAEIRAGQALLLEILGEPVEAKASLVDLQYGALPLIKAMTEAGSAERDMLVRALTQAMDQAWEDTTLSAKARVLTVRVLIRALRLENPHADLSEGLKRTIRERLGSIAAEAETPYQRQSVMFYVGWYQHEIGDDEAALATLEKEIATALAPYYYMSYLAEIEKERGNPTAALNWSGRAFAAAQGAATRMQWGIEHLGNLLALSPDDDKAVSGVLDELSRTANNTPDSLYQRTRVRLDRLQKPLLSWALANPQRQEMLRQWRAGWLPACESLRSGAPAAATCRGFLSALEA